MARNILEDRKKLEDLITEIVKTGENTLDQEALKSIKNIIRSDNSHTELAFSLIMQQLAAKHSQIRLLSVLLIDELFMRSKVFRELMSKDFKLFIELAVGSNPSKPLPPPSFAAQLTRERSLEFIEKWTEQFGNIYTQLKTTHNYLKGTLHMDFPDMRGRRLAEEQRRRERDEQTQRIIKVKYDKMKGELEEIEPEMEENLEEMDESFQLLLPTNLFETSNTTTTSSQSDENENENKNSTHYMPEILQKTGVVSETYELEITIDKKFTAKKTHSNAAVFDALRDSLRTLIKNHLPLIREWNKILLKLKTEGEEKAVQDALIRKIATLQGRMNFAISKCKDLEITVNPNSEPVGDILNLYENQDNVNNNNSHNNNNNVNNNNNNNVNMNNNNNNHNSFQFETSNQTFVDEEGVEWEEGGRGLGEGLLQPIETKRMKPRPNITVNRSTNTTSTTNTPNTNNNNKSENSPTTKSPTTGTIKENENKEDLLARAPVMEGSFTYFWGKKEVDMNSGLECRHRFLGESSHETVVPVEKLTTETMKSAYYQTKLPTSRRCGVLLRDGVSLCERRDFIRCPYHGVIVPRDERGNPIEGMQNEAQALGMGLKPEETIINRTKQISPPEAERKRKTNSKLVDINEEITSPKTRLEQRLDERNKKIKLTLNTKVVNQGTIRLTKRG